MTLNVTLYLFDAESGAVEEAEFADRGSPSALLDAGADALLVLSGGLSEVAVRDQIDDLLLGLCVGVPRGLQAGEAVTHVSFAGYDPAEFVPEGDTVRITCGRDSLRAPLADTIAALKAAAGRYGAMLKAAFPGEPGRWRELEAFGAA